MKAKYFYISVITAVCLLSFSTTKSVITDKDVSGNKIIILGVVEYDYSQIENKGLKGLDIFMDSKEKHSDFNLPEKSLQNNRLIKQQFISLFGDSGIYRLFYKQNVSSAESDNLLVLMDMDRNKASSEKVAIQEYSIAGGKMVNIGKLIVTYHGGQEIDGKINYSFSFKTNSNDTSALSVFRETYSSIYKKYSNNIYMFKSEK
jgi:hypothetical protein